MIFGRFTGPNGEIVLLGLSAENLKQVADGQPMSVGPMKGDSAMDNLTIIVMAGETGEEIEAKLKKAGLIPVDPPTEAPQ